VTSAQISWRVGRWMADPGHAGRVAEESSTILRAVVSVLRDEDVEQVIDNTIVKRIAEPLWGPPIGRVLAELLADNRQLPLVDMLAERAHQWALASQETIDRIVLRDAPQWAPKFVNILLSEKIYRELVEFTWKVRSNPEHEVRLAANKFLEEFADDLQHDEATIKKAERIKSQIMGREEITGMAEATWRAAKRLILESPTIRTARCAARSPRMCANSVSGCATTTICAPRSTAGSTAVPGIWWKTMLRRSPPWSPIRSPGGMPMRPVRRSNYRSGVICNSFGSTALWSDRWPVWRSTRSRMCCSAGNRHAGCSPTRC